MYATFKFDGVGDNRAADDLHLHPRQSIAVLSIRCCGGVPGVTGTQITAATCTTSTSRPSGKRQRWKAAAKPVVDEGPFDPHYWTDNIDGHTRRTATITCCCIMHFVDNIEPTPRSITVISVLGNQVRGFDHHRWVRQR